MGNFYGFFLRLQITELPVTPNLKRRFIAKLSIALEEIDESVFWLEMTREC